MAVTQQSQGDTALTVGAAETSLATITTAGVYTLRLDCNALVADDVLGVRVYEQYQTTGQGGTERLTDEWYIFGTTLTSKNFDTAPYVCLNSLRFAILQSAGTSRTILWEVSQIQ